MAQQSFAHTVLKLVRTGNDLTLRQLAVMVESRHTAITVRELAARLEISRPVISRVADRLESLGLLNRIDDPADRRSVLLELTPTGRKFIDGLN